MSYSMTCDRQKQSGVRLKHFLCIVLLGLALIVNAEQRSNQNAKSPLSGISRNGVHHSVSDQTDDSEDLTSINAVVKSLYASITFRAGGKPDMSRFRSLFSPDALFIRITQDGQMKMDRDSFISGFSGRVQSGAMQSFYEAEIARKTHVFGSMAQVFTSYHKGVNTEDPKHFGRGINSLHLFHDSKRWWICSLLWQDESSGNPIPDEYLR